ncbi:MAG: alpha/beta hydrolase [Isosphaeraceae bacterium]
MVLSDANTARDVFIPVSDGLSLHARHWSLPEPRGIVVVAHGFGEHGGWYDHVAQAVGPVARVDFVTPDLRGHGRSPGRRGVVRTYDDLTSDLLAAFEWAGRRRPGLPRFVLGHSNGGQLALRAALDPVAGPQIAGLIVSNPSLRLAVRVPGYKLRLAGFLRRFAPGVTLSAPIDPSSLTRDLDMQQKRREDQLTHGRMSAPLFFGMVEGGRMLLERGSEIRAPILMIIGSADPLIDPLGSREVFDRLASPDKTFLLYPEMRHEPFNELGRERVLDDLTTWIVRHLPVLENG